MCSVNACAFPQRVFANKNKMAATAGRAYPSRVAGGRLGSITRHNTGHETAVEKTINL